MQVLHFLCHDPLVVLKQHHFCGLWSYKRWSFPTGKFVHVRIKKLLQMMLFSQNPGFQLAFLNSFCR